MPKRKKYQAKHDWVRKNVPKEFQQLVDSGVDHIGGIIDKAGPRDIIYVLAYAATVSLTYRIITGGIGNIITDFFHMIFPPPPWIAPDEEEPFDPLKIDWNALITSLAVAYMVLKIDVADVAGAITKLSASALGGLGGFSPVAP